MVINNFRKIGSRFRRPFDFHLGTEDSVHLAAYILVGNCFALIEGGNPLANFSPKPFFMVKVASNQLAHDLIRPFASLRGDAV